MRGSEVLGFGVAGIRGLVLRQRVDELDAVAGEGCSKRDRQAESSEIALETKPRAGGTTPGYLADRYMSSSSGARQVELGDEVDPDAGEVLGQR